MLAITPKMLAEAKTNRKGEARQWLFPLIMGILRDDPASRGPAYSR
jgi:hypothetical protein